MNGLVGKVILHVVALESGCTARPANCQHFPVSRKGGVFWVGVIRVRALTFGVYIRAPDFWKLPLQLFKNDCGFLKLAPWRYGQLRKARRIGCGAFNSPKLLG